MCPWKVGRAGQDLRRRAHLPTGNRPGLQVHRATCAFPSPRLVPGFRPVAWQGLELRAWDACPQRPIASRGCGATALQQIVALMERQPLGTGCIEKRG